MIFVTLGTHEAPFERLIRALEHLPREERLVVQHGFSPPGPPWATSMDFVPFDRVAAYIRAARAVVMHAGVGSIMVSLANGKRPIVVPRLHRHGEHVDDHQLSLAERLHANGLATLVADAEKLPVALAAARSDAAVPIGAARALTEELRGYFAAEVGEAATLLAAR